MKQVPDANAGEQNTVALESAVKQNSILAIPDAKRVRVQERVGGWLLVFCFSLVGVIPFLSFASLADSYRSVAEYEKQFPGLFTIFIAESALVLVLVGLGIYAGISLWLIKPNAVRSAKMFLLSLLAYLAGSFCFPYLGDLPEEARAAMLAGTIRQAGSQLAYFVTWFSYLTLSKRVRETYRARGNPTSPEEH